MLRVDLHRVIILFSGPFRRRNVRICQRWNVSCMWRNLKSKNRGDCFDYCSFLWRGNHTHARTHSRTHARARTHTHTHTHYTTLHYTHTNTDTGTQWHTHTSANSVSAYLATTTNLCFTEVKKIFILFYFIFIFKLTLKQSGSAEWNQSKPQNTNNMTNKQHFHRLARTVKSSA